MVNYEYPLVIETGETFLSDSQLLRFISQKCGQTTADFLTQRIDTDEMPVGGTEFLKKLKEALESLSDSVNEVDNDVHGILNLINRETGVN